MLVFLGAPAFIPESIHPSLDGILDLRSFFRERTGLLARILQHIFRIHKEGLRFPLCVGNQIVRFFFCFGDEIAGFGPDGGKILFGIFPEFVSAFTQISTQFFDRAVRSKDCANSLSGRQASTNRLRGVVPVGRPVRPAPNPSASITSARTRNGSTGWLPVTRSSMG